MTSSADLVSASDQRLGDDEPIQNAIPLAYRPLCNEDVADGLLRGR